MPKEKNYNPVQEAKKAEKQKTLKKQKAQLQAQRNEKLARRNPFRLQRDIDALKEADQSGSLRPHEKQRLSELEKDLAAVNKARAALGDKAPQFKALREDFGDRGERGGDRGGRGGRGGWGGVLGKRGRDGSRKGRDGDDSSDTDADVKNIPMPRDTPPPIPHRRGHGRDAYIEDAPPEPKKPTLVYEAAPQVRDLKKEAVRFMPAAVANKMKLAKGEGRLLEPEEFDKLKEEGYMREAKEKEGKEGKDDEAEAQVEAQPPVEVDPELEAFLKAQGVDSAEKAAEAAVQKAEYEMMAAEAQGEMTDLKSEGRIAEKKLHHVEMEEVQDEDL
ncbi:hypothetical protein K458DRAFT_413643 [Lentithecium fluviatile CBS 122367]|uniref:Wbp11/ELF5/Saf1 N-terminal domain-containing protein n=1 Tax=Lentithecium fluviatile CBS 122367 TaxID=1168545 RepID=A0A6G1JGQ5_9PLEO|nr:hypothetical protein K458DRAFT_413643 [Lentithecium fluviatile CBS 122367]